MMNNIFMRTIRLFYSSLELVLIWCGFWREINERKRARVGGEGAKAFIRQCEIMKILFEVFPQLTARVVQTTKRGENSQQKPAKKTSKTQFN